MQSIRNVLGAPPHLLPTFGRNEDYARPEVRISAQGYHWVVIERGQELQHRTTNQLHELLLWIAEDITFSLASEYELAHRLAGQDSRILLFAKQEELMRRLDPDFAAQLRSRHQNLLRHY